MAAKKKTATKKATKKVSAPTSASEATKKISAKKTVGKSSTKKLSVKKTLAKSSAKKTVAKSSAKKVSGKTLEKTAKTASSSAASSVKTPDPDSIVGKKAPAFDLVDHTGRRVTSAGLAGKPYVLYFYPKDNTPGCTKEACDFRDAHANFRRAKVTVLGVSPDSEKSHANFAGKYELPFPLLVDGEKQLAQAYGAWALKKNYGREYWGIVRSTFLVGADGKVKRQWRGVRVAGHVDEVLGEVRA